MSEALYRITVRKADEPRGTAITRLSPLRRANVGANAGIALRFNWNESETVLAALREHYPNLIFSRVTCSQ